MRYAGAVFFAAASVACLLGSIVAGRENRGWAAALILSCLILGVAAASLVV